MKKNEMNKSDIFAPLRAEKAGVSMDQLQQHVASSPVRSLLNLRFTALALSGAAMIGGALFFTLNTKHASEVLPENMSTSVERPIVSPVEAAITQVPVTQSSESIPASKMTDEANMNRHSSSLADHNAESNAIENDKEIIRDEMNHPTSVIPANSIPAEKQYSDKPTDAKQVQEPASISNELPVAKAQSPSPGSSPDPMISLHERSVDEETPDRIYGGFQGGVIISSLNTLGGGFEIDFDHFWQHIAFRYSSTFGTKTNSSELFRTIDGNPNDFPHYNYSQSVVEYTIQFGATIRQGNFWATFSAGPNYTNSHALMTETTLANTPVSGQPFYPKYDTIYSGSVWRGLGASAEATFGYKFNSRIGAEITGFASDHTQVAYGGILFSVVFGIM